MSAELIPSQDIPIVQMNIGPDYARELEQVAPGINQIVSTQTQEGESWIDSLTRLLPVIAATYQQREILQIQLERARNGLPPINANEFAAGVQVGVTPDLQKMLLIGGVALVAVIWFASKRRG